MLVETRDQRTVQLLEADASSGATRVVAEQTDPRWVELTEEAPVRLEDGRVVDVEADADADTYRLTVSAEPVTPPGLQVREVLSAGEDVLFRASDGDPTEIHLWRWTPRAARSGYRGSRGCTRAPRAATYSCGSRRRHTT